MRPCTVISVSVALSLLAGAYLIWQGAGLIIRLAPAYGMEPLVVTGAAVQLMLAAWAVANAIGLRRRRGWARVSLLIFAGVIIFWSITGSVGALFALGNLPEGSLRTLGTVAELLPRAVLLLASIWWFIVLNRPPLRQALSSRAES